MRLVEGAEFDGRYTLTRRIGSGGMADVWEASDTELGRRVALKVLHDNFARDAEFVERFKREASSAAALQHPNLVGVFDRGESEGSYYIAMELVEGSSLRELIDHGMELDEAYEVARQVLEGVEYAHQNGIIHRDLKPMNVLIDRGGRVKVTDFGIARAGDVEITRTGSVMGTAQYLSPEQAQGRPVTAASDLYAVGVMLFEMVTGRVPFDGDNTVAVAMKQVTEAPPAPSALSPGVPPALDSVVLRALAKDPANRYASASEMRAAVDAAEANPQMGGHTERIAAYTGPVPAEDGRDRRWWWAAAIVLAVAAIIAAILLLGGDDDLITVPGLKNKNESQARLQLTRAGFEVDVDRVPSSVPEGRVIEQDPRGGVEAERGSTVTLDVSLGPEPIAVPDVSGKGRKRAVKLLEKAGFERIETEKRASEDLAPGRVIETQPSAGTEIEPGATVTLVVSQGSELVAVPDVVGDNRIDAAAELRREGFVVDQDSEDSDEPENQVIRQIPGAGTELEPGERVTIVYSTGAGSIVIESYVGQKQGFAERKLGNKGLEVDVRTETVTDRSDDGIVIEQSPGGGARLSPGDRVSIVVGEFIEPEPDPDPAPGDSPGAGGP